MLSLRAISLRLLLSTLGLLLVPLAAAVDWPPISPEEQALKDVPSQPGAPAVILLRQEVADDLNNFHSTYKRIKVLTDAGRKYADIELPYNRHGFSIGELAGRTVHADGTVVPFEAKPFDKVIVRGKGFRYQVKAFTLPDVQVGSILDVRYSLRFGDRMLLPPEWMVQDDLFQRKATFKYIPFQGKSNMEVMLPHGQVANRVSWTPFLPAQYKPEEHTAPQAAFGHNQVGYWVSLDMSDVPAFVQEPFMPPPDILKWRVNFYYLVSPKQEEYWKAQGKFWEHDVESFLGKKKCVAEATAQLISATDTPEQKTRKIYAFVSQLENTSYVPYRPQQEQKVLGIKLNAGVEDVLRQRSGDHDDLNRLFVAMVRAAGLPASLMLVPNREHNVFLPALLSMSQFDAEIAIVRLDSKDVFLDPGTKFCPYGLTDWRYASVTGLRESDGKAETAESPLSSYTQAMTTRLGRFKMNEEGRAEGLIGLAFYGLEAMQWRQQGGKTDDEGRKKLLEDEVKSFLPSDNEVTLTKQPEWDKTEEPLIAQFSVKASLLVNAGKRALIPLHPFEFNGTPRFSAGQRVNAVYFYYPSREIDEFHITLPSNVQIENLPPDDVQKLQYAMYKSEQKPEGTNGIFARRDLVMGGMLFPPTMYAEVKGFYDKIKAGDDQTAVLKALARAEGN